MAGPACSHMKAAGSVDDGCHAWACSIPAAQRTCAVILLLAGIQRQQHNWVLGAGQLVIHLMMRANNNIRRSSSITPANTQADEVMYCITKL